MTCACCFSENIPGLSLDFSVFRLNAPDDESSLVDLGALVLLVQPNPGPYFSSSFSFSWRNFSSFYENHNRVEKQETNS